MFLQRNDNAVAASSLKEKVIELVTAYWKQYGAAYLLSALGPGLTKAGFNHRLILGEQKLSDFVANECANELKIVPNPKDPLVLGVIPAGITVNQENAGYLFAKRADSPRFPKGVWAAFLVELKPRLRRYVNLDHPVNFEDVPELSSSPGPTFVEVERKYIRQSYEDFVPNEKTLERLNSWANDKQIDIKQLEVPSTRLFDIVGTSSSGAGESLLDLMYKVLTEEQQHRVSLPLDVLKKLSEPWKAR
jgi:hypothetical protein